MMKKIILILIFASSMQAFAQVTKTVSGLSAGSLSTLFTEEEKTTVSNLSVSGNMDARDVKFMRDELSALTDVDISAVNIMYYSGYDGTNLYTYNYIANEMPEYSFMNPVSTTLTNIILPSSINIIRYNAFWGCNALTAITVPSGVTSIEDNAFDGCTNLAEITLMEGLSTIGSKAFAECISVTSLNIPSSVTSIGSLAFSGCTGITSINIGNSVTEIGDMAFYACTSLAEINVGSGNLNFASVDGVLFNKSISKLIDFPKGKTGSYTIPNSVTSLQYGALSKCIGLTSLTIGSGLNMSEDDNFQGCANLSEINVHSSNQNLSSLAGVLFNKNKTALIIYPEAKQGSYSIPNSVTVIRENAFYYSTGLTNIDIPDNVTTLGNGNFYNCSALTNIILGNGITGVSDYSFSQCAALNTVTLGDAVSTIGIYSFDGCPSLQSIIVNPANNFYSSENGVLFNKNKSSLIICPVGKVGSYTIPTSVTSIIDKAFFFCYGLTDIILPNGLTTIGKSAFAYCSGFSNLTIPNSVTTIDEAGFFYCGSLTTLNIGSAVTSIGDYAFEGCFNLETIHSANVIHPSIGINCFINSNNVTDVFVPTNSAVLNYKADDAWIGFFSGNIIKVDAPTKSAALDNNTIKVFGTKQGINVDGIADGEIVDVYSVSGVKLQSVKSKGERILINMNSTGIYFVKMANKTAKVVF